MNRLGYMFRETFQSLRRNFLLTAAAIIVVFVSLSILGSSFLVRQAVDNATARWEGGIEFVVWMNADATPEQHSAIRASLEGFEILGFIPVDEALLEADQDGALPYPDPSTIPAPIREIASQIQALARD